MNTRRSLRHLLLGVGIFVCALAQGCGTVQSTPLASVKPLPIFYDSNGEKPSIFMHRVVWEVVFTGKDPAAAKIRVLEEDYSSNRDGGPGMPDTTRYYVKAELIVRGERHILTERGHTPLDAPNRRDLAVEEAVAALAKKAARYL